MTDPTPATGTTQSASAPFIRFVGVTITIIGLVGTIAVVADLSRHDFGEPDTPSATVWLAGLSGLVCVGVGVIVFALGLLLERLGER